MSGILGNSREEVELTKKLAATLVKSEVIEPMNAIGWGHGAPPSPEMIAAYKASQEKNSPPVAGQPAPGTGAPAASPAPAAPPASGQPAAPVAASPAPTVAKTDAPPDLAAAQNLLGVMESLRDANGLIMGKYKTVDDALKGAGHLANMAKSALGRAEAADAALRAAAPAPLATPPAAAPAAVPVSKPFVPASRPELEAARANLDLVLSKIAEDGGILSGDHAKSLSAAQRELSKQEARALVDEDRERSQHATSSETEKWSAISAYMDSKYPEAKNFTDEVGLFVRSNPLLAEAIDALVAQGRDQRAIELSWIEYDKSRGGSGLPNMSRAEAEVKEADLQAREQVRKELRDAALKDAGIVQGSAGGAGVHENVGSAGSSQDEINAYADGMRRTGEALGGVDAARWRHAVIGRFLPPGLFGPQG